jgi:hypothetical protein
MAVKTIECVAVVNSNGQFICAFANRQAAIEWIERQNGMRWEWEEEKGRRRMVDCKLKMPEEIKPLRFDSKYWKNPNDS